jgi:hypothetical protein
MADERMMYLLTSPAMKDGEKGIEGIAELQKALTTNVFLPEDADRPENPGKKDGKGVYGPETAAAVHLRKFWMGYPVNKSNGFSAGERFHSYLLGETKPTAAMIALRRKRLRRRRAGGSPKLKALKIALSQKGVKETPRDTNKVKYSAWYGLVGPWCVMYQAWVGAQAKEAWAKKGVRYASVAAVEAAAAQHDFGMSFTSHPEPGDLVTYDWPDEPGPSNHIGRFVKWTIKGKTFQAIEGNTSTGSNSNGGQVMLRTRDVSLVHHFIHLDE